MPPSPSLTASLLLTRCASACHTSTTSAPSLLARSLPCALPSSLLHAHQHSSQQHHQHTTTHSLCTRAALTQMPLHGLPFTALLSLLCVPTTPALLPSSVRWFTQGHAGSKWNSASQQSTSLGACLQAISKANTPSQLQQAMYQLAKRVQQDARHGVKLSSRDRDSTVQAVHALPARFLGQGAPPSSSKSAQMPLHQLNSKELSLLAWSLPPFVQLDSRVKSSQLRALVDAMAQHAVRIRVMQHPAETAWMNTSMLLLGVSKMGTKCRDSLAVRQLFDEAAGQLPQLVSTKQPCVPQSVSNALLAFAYVDYPGDLKPFVEELVRNLGWLMKGAKPQELANTLWALATLSCNPGASTVTKLATALAERSSKAAPQELSNTLWALTRLRVNPGASTVSKLAVAMAERSSGAKPQNLSNTLWALSELRWYDSGLYSKLVKGLLLKISSSSPDEVGQQLSNTMLGCALVGHFDSSVDALAEWGSQQNLLCWNEQDLSNVLHAWAILSATAGRNTPAMRALAQHLFAEASRRGAAAFLVHHDGPWHLGKLFSAHQEAQHVCLPGGGVSDGELLRVVCKVTEQNQQQTGKKLCHNTSAVSSALQGVYEVQAATVQGYHTLLLRHPSCPYGVVIEVTCRLRDYLYHPPDRLYGKAALRIEQVKRGCDVLVLCDESELEAGREQVCSMLLQRIEQAVSEHHARSL